MLTSLQQESFVRPADTSKRLHVSPSTALDGGHAELISRTPQKCVHCEFHEGLPVIRQRVPSYYVSRPNGDPMLTVERRSGEQLRICGTVDLIVLQIHRGEVKLGISPSSDETV